MSDKLPKNYLFLALAVVTVAITALLFRYLGSTWAAIIVALIIANLVVVFYSFKRGWREGQGKLRGNQPCPECGSLQTDSVKLPLATGGERLIMRCFACDHEFDPPSEHEVAS